jgi:hypothetical protein
MQKIQIGPLGLQVHGSSRMSSREASKRNGSVEPSAAEAMVHRSLRWSIGSRMLHTGTAAVKEPPLHERHSAGVWICSSIGEHIGQPQLL